ncbi:hypothetical protein [Pumilibacter intestinalis]|uniref:hypothetical protein n=1 Tax=Pumilibacter intestinalis TaxID=2941511 RepID=UPI00203C311F|nr:hypothetical protein [Pumilibacter intestinalis]
MTRVYRMGLPRSLHSLAMTTPARHCEGIYARGNPIHGTRKVATPFSWLILPRSFHSLAMTRAYRRGLLRYARNDKDIPHEIAALVALARNDKGIPQGIAALVSLARNDKGIPQGIAALVALTRNDKGIPQEIAALALLARNDKVTRHCEGACTRGNLLRNTRTIRLKNRGGHAILYV